MQITLTDTEAQALQIAIQWESSAELRAITEKLKHAARKAEGARVATLLDALPLGTEFTLANAGRAYSGTYRKNSAGLWDQVWAVETPLVRNFEADHLGFCVGFAAVAGAVERTAA